MSLSKSTITSTVWDYIVLTVGVIIYTIAWESFMIPCNIASGGLTGACAIIQYATGGLIPVAYSYFVLNAILIIVGSWVLGKGFGIRTIYCIVLSSLFLKIIPSLEWMKCVEGQFLYIDNKLMVAIIGGLVEALAVGLIMGRNGSTGGSDILALIVNKFWPISPGKFFLYSDLVIIASILLVPGKAFVDMMYGYVSMIVFSFMVDFVLLGGKSTMQILVFSEKYEEIADYIIHVLDRGVTALNGIGWYSKQDKKILLILVRKNQIHEVTKVINNIDPKAFVSVSPATSVYGEGFDEIKTGLRNDKKKWTKAKS